MTGIDELLKQGEEQGKYNHQLIFVAALAARMSKTDGYMSLDEVKIIQDYAKKFLGDVGIRYEPEIDKDGVKLDKVKNITFFNHKIDNHEGVTISTEELIKVNTELKIDNKQKIFNKLTQQQSDEMSVLGNIAQTGNEDSKLLATALAYVTREAKIKGVIEAKNIVNSVEKFVADGIDIFLPEANIEYSPDNKSIDGIAKVNANPVVYNFAEGQKPSLSK
jgi:hypothetical protein